jgi:hypothetical protein
LCQPPADQHDQRTYTIVDGIIQRVDAYNQAAYLHGRDLRGWNFAFNGSFLLHLSPFGVEQMNGRYSALFEQEALCLEGIQRLAAVLAARALPVPSVYTLPDHDSQVLATATARYLGCPLTPWPPGGAGDPGLIVIHDLDRIAPALLATFQEHRPRQLVWAHAVSWMEDSMLGPDFITYLYETTLSPWAERRPEQAHLPEQRTGTVDQLAAGILQATLADDALADLPALCAWIAALPALPAPHAPGALRSHGARRNFFADSPVPSASFRFYDHPEAGVAAQL